MEAQAWFTAVANNDLRYVLKNVNKMKGQRNSNGATALILAVQLNYMQLVILLAKHEAGFLDYDGTSALLEAVKRSNLCFVRVLGRLEFDLLVGQGKRHTALDEALAMDTCSESIIIELISIQGCQYDSLGRSSLQTILESPKNKYAISALHKVKYLAEQLHSALLYSNEKCLDPGISKEIERVIQSLRDPTGSFPSLNIQSISSFGTPDRSHILYSNYVQSTRSLSVEVPRSRRTFSKSATYARNTQSNTSLAPLTTPLILQPPAVPPQAMLTTSKTNVRIQELEAQVADLEKKLEASRTAYMRQTSQLLEISKVRKEESSLKARQAKHIIDLEHELRISRATTPLLPGCEDNPTLSIKMLPPPSITTIGIQVCPDAKNVLVGADASWPPMLGFSSVTSLSITPQSFDCTAIRTTSFYESSSPSSSVVTPTLTKRSYVIVSIDQNSEEYNFDQVTLDSCQPLFQVFSSSDKHYKENGISIQIYEDDNKNELIDAVLARNLEKVRLLSNLYGLCDTSGKTALMYAAEIDFHEAILLLAPKEAGMMRPQCRYLRPGTALMHAAINGHKRSVELLLTYHDEVKARTKFDWTALMFAAVQNYDEIVKLLAPLESRMITSTDCMVDQSFNGITALLMAIKLDNFESARVLAPYEFDIKDSRGLTAGLLARDSGLRAYLRSFST